jgi:hypothetical protein
MRVAVLKLVSVKAPLISRVAPACRQTGVVEGQSQDVHEEVDSFAGQIPLVPARASAICWTATVCGATVAARPDHVEVEFFIHGELLRLVFDTAAVRGCDVEHANKSEMHRAPAWCAKRACEAKVSRVVFRP